MLIQHTSSVQRRSSAMPRSHVFAGLPTDSRNVGFTASNRSASICSWPRATRNHQTISLTASVSLAKKVVSRPTVGIRATYFGRSHFHFTPRHLFDFFDHESDEVFLNSLHVIGCLALHIHIDSIGIGVDQENANWTTSRSDDEVNPVSTKIAFRIKTPDTQENQTGIKP
jgi:hypothetical protein